MIVVVMFGIFCNLFSYPKKANVILNICVFLLFCMNLKFDLLHEGENRLGLFENRVLGRIFFPEMKEVTGCWSKERG